jgi:hypothetical protein
MKKKKYLHYALILVIYINKLQQSLININDNENAQYFYLRIFSI